VPRLDKEFVFGTPEALNRRIRAASQIPLGICSSVVASSRAYWEEIAGCSPYLELSLRPAASRTHRRSNARPYSRSEN
jgi:hypothetical protein